MEHDRRSGHDRRSNWIEAVVVLRLGDDDLRALADDYAALLVDRLDEDTARGLLVELLERVRTRMIDGNGNT